MQEPKYMAQGDWVTYDTKELGRVRMFRAMSEDSASYLAHKLTTFDQLVFALTKLESVISEDPNDYADPAQARQVSDALVSARSAIKKAKEGQ